MLEHAPPTGTFLEAGVFRVHYGLQFVLPSVKDHRLGDVTKHSEGNLSPIDAHDAAFRNARSHGNSVGFSRFIPIAAPSRFNKREHPTATGGPTEHCFGHWTALPPAPHADSRHLPRHPIVPGTAARELGVRGRVIPGTEEELAPPRFGGPGFPGKSKRDGNAVPVRISPLVRTRSPWAQSRTWRDQPLGASLGSAFPVPHRSFAAQIAYRIEGFPPALPKTTGQWPTRPGNTPL